MANLLNINGLKDSIENLNQEGIVYVDLKISGTQDFIRFGIIEISKPRIGLELSIEDLHHKKLYKLQQYYCIEKASPNVLRHICFILYLFYTMHKILTN